MRPFCCRSLLENSDSGCGSTAWDCACLFCFVSICFRSSCLGWLDCIDTRHFSVLPFTSMPLRFRR